MHPISIKGSFQVLLSQPVSDDHADKSRIEDGGEVLADLVGNEAQAVELRDKQHDDTGNEKQVTELGFRRFVHICQPDQWWPVRKEKSLLRYQSFPAVPLAGFLFFGSCRHH